MDILDFRAICQVVLLTSLSLRTTKSEVFTAVDKITTVFNLKAKILNKVIEHSKKEGLDDTLKSNVQYLISEHRKYEGEAGWKLGSPIVLYHQLLLMTSKVESLVNKIVCDGCPKSETPTAQAIKQLQNTAIDMEIWPTEHDIRGAAISLVRLAEVYTLDLTTLLGGRIKHIQTEPITDDGFFQIVMAAEKLGQGQQGIKWMEEGIRRALNGRNKQEVIQFYKGLANVYFQADKLRMSQKILQEAAKKFPGVESLAAEMDSYKEYAEKTGGPDQSVIVLQEQKSTFTNDYERLCRGQEAPYRDGLCQYKQTRIPIYRVKEEVLSRDPRIAMFHDVIYENETRHITEKALQNLIRPKVSKEATPPSGGIIKESTWFWDKDDPLVAKITRRMELFTGLSMEERSVDACAEALQVTNYGIGGMYEPHYDFFNISYNRMDDPNPELVDSGDRLASWVFYLSDVQLGGATVFQKANLRVPVIKGAAIFYYNLKRDSWGDDRLLTADCPVLFGSKWVATKWVRYNGNMFNAKCGLTKDALYEL